jgi:tetratricopeptide (TPR) repeat protein
MFVQTGRFDEAIIQYQKALKNKANSAEIHNNFGGALAARGQVDEAIAHYQKALELQPDFADARINLGVAQSKREGILKLLAGRRESLRSRPKDVALLNDTAWLLATNPNASIRNGAEAVELAQRAAQLSGGQEPAVLGTLAAAFAEAGRFPETLETARKALDLAQQQNNQSLAESIKAKIPLYEAGTPFRQIAQPARSGSSKP